MQGVVGNTDAFVAAKAGLAVGTLVAARNTRPLRQLRSSPRIRGATGRARATLRIEWLRGIATVGAGVLVHRADRPRATLGQGLAGCRAAVGANPATGTP